MQYDSTTLPIRLVSAVVIFVATAFLVGACDSAGPSVSGSSVKVGFGTSYQISKSARSTTSSHDSLVVAGANGELKIADVQLIVSEVELDGDADSAEFEADPTLLDLPLDTTDVAPLANSEIPPATYQEFEFEVEDITLGANEDDEEGLQALRDDVRAAFPDWPENASMVVIGTFTPTDGSSQPFTTFVEAEIEVERPLNPPVEVTAGGARRALTVRLDPTRWFSRSDGTVQNLSRSNDELVELGVEFEDGVSEIEVDDEEGEGVDDDDGDDDGEDSDDD
jgi:hypothetical protein